jgi:hypothetical protein
VAATSLDELLERSRPQWHRRPGFMLVFGLAAIVIVLGFVGYRIMGSPGSGPALSAADGNASPTPAASGAAGRPDAARSARATAGSSAPAAAHSAQATSPAPPTAGSTPAPDPGQQARPHTMAPASAAAFGPGGTGDDPQNAHLAIDGMRGTAWRTDWYTSAQFGNLYSGTGLLLDMGRPVTVTGIRVTLGAAAGAHFQIRVGDQPNLGALRPVAGSAGPGGIVRLGLSHPTLGRYVLVWFTELPRDPAGTYQAAIYGIGVKGRP